MIFPMLPATFLLLMASSATFTQAAWTTSPSDLLDQYEPSPTFKTTTPISPFASYKLWWSYSLEKEHITFVIEAKTTGWVGMGIAEAAGMRGADIMMGHVLSSGKVVVEDFHSIANALPNKDGCQDWEALAGEEDATTGSTLLVFGRKFRTNDSNDHPILIQSIKRLTLLLAHGADGDDTDYNMHPTGKNVKYPVDLSKATSADKSNWRNEKIATHGITYLDLRASGTSPTSAAAKEVNGRQGPTVGGFNVPATRTTYVDFCYPLSVNSNWARENKYMIAFEGLVDPQGRTSNPNNIHHTVLYAYDGDDCSGTDSIIWVGGVTFFEDLPENVGISFERFKSFKLQTHYDNPSGTIGLRDDSGVRIYFQNTRPKHEAGTMQLGDGTLELSRSSGTAASINSQTPAVIPVGRSYYSFTCPSTVTSSWPVDSITVFASILHMHQTGDMMYTEIIHGDGTPSKRVNSVQYFDFDHQDPTLVQPYVIKKGDKMVTRCYYNNPGTQNPLTFGLGSEQEMCIDFIYYYPYHSQIKQHCTMITGASGYDGRFGGYYNGMNTITDDDDPGMRAFGANGGNLEDALLTCDSSTSNSKSNSSQSETSGERETNRHSWHLPEYSCPRGYDCMFQNSCPSLFGATCPKGMMCMFPSQSVDSAFRCPGDHNSKSEATCTGQDYLNNNQYKTEFKSDHCPAGVYCPTSTSSKICPEGYYCTSKTTSPQECGSGVICRIGARFPISWLLATVAILMVIVYQVIATYMCGRKGKDQQQRQIASSPTTGLPTDAPNKKFQEIGLEIHFNQLSLYMYNKHLLKGVSGRVNKGELLAVMGPSGAGKSTLMNVLTGKIIPTSGTIKINGQSDFEFNAIKSMTGYVPQNDIMLEDLTVEENLMYSANTRFLGTTEDRKNKVDEVLVKLGMTHVRHSLIGDDRRRGLSGGERKRVSIGIELVANPAVLCLDEPTTGLDSASAEIVVDILKSLSNEGHTVVCILHQPRSNIFRSFDNILCLASGGIPAFYGKPEEVKMFAESCGARCPNGKNPADHLIDLVSGRINGVTAKIVTETFASWNVNPLTNNRDESKKHSNTLANISSRPSSISSVCSQFLYGFSRSLKQQMRDTASSVLYYTLCVGMIAALSTGFSPFIQDDLEGSYRPPIGKSLRDFCPPFMSDSCGTVINFGGLEQMMFFFSMSIGCIGMIAASRAFSEKAALVMRRESEVGLSTAATVISKMCADMVQIILLSALAMGLWCVMGYPGGQWRWLIVGIGLMFTTYGWGYLVSQLVSRSAIMTTCLVVAVVFSAMNGVNPKLSLINEIPVVNVIWACSYARWVSEAIYYIFTKHHIDSGLDVQHGANDLGFIVNSNQFVIDMVVVFVHGLVLRLMAGVIIIRRVTKMKV
jgi:ABC-type multidrug transport system ATPase subunit